MPHNTLLPYAATGAFSHTIQQYLAADPALRPYYAYDTDKAGVAAAIEARKSAKVDRKALVEVLQSQYQRLPQQSAATANIARLLNENTFTVCTAHQPNLCTGFLYFVYKILHAIRLADTLAKDFPQQHFVPVYYMGSEDADLDELGNFRYAGRRFVWDAAGQTGAVGNMRTESLKPLLDELFGLMGPPGIACDELKEILSDAYLKHDTIAEATQYLVHVLFGKYGLVVLNPDDARLKAVFAPVIEEDLLRQSAEGIVKQTIESLAGSGFRSQASPRAINLFYLLGDIRQRIERRGEEWHVVDTGLHFSRQQLLAELTSHPERFSPNVILRPLYQEAILPDIAFIGGGAEVAYWLQLRALFEHHHVFYPAIILRQSFLWIDKPAAALRAKTGLSIPAIFEEEHLLVNRLARETGNINFEAERRSVESLLASLHKKVTAVDTTLGPSAAAALAKMRRQLTVLEQKTLRAQKRKVGVETERIHRLKDLLFPNGGLQERTENFIPYYLAHGAAYFDALLAAMPSSYEHQFAVVVE